MRPVGAAICFVDLGAAFRRPIATATGFYIVIGVRLLHIIIMGLVNPHPFKNCIHRLLVKEIGIPSAVRNDILRLDLQLVVELHEHLVVRSRCSVVHLRFLRAFVLIARGTLDTTLGHVFFVHLAGGTKHGEETRCEAGFRVGAPDTGVVSLVCEAD